MRNFYDKHKQIINETLLFSLIVIILFVLLNLNGQTFGQVNTDFLTQHVRFIDYLRNSFWATKDLAPQVTFNFGTSQNMASLFYYGQYNPLVMLSYLFPFISTMYWLQFMNAFLIITTFLAMNVLLRKLQINRVNVIVFSILTAIAPPLLYHMGHHLMFIYYFPVFVLSLYAIIRLIEDKIKWIFIVCVALIFYTNFFFALAIGFLQLVFFLSYLFFKTTKSNAEKYNRVKILIFTYLVGILIGMLVFLPQALPIVEGARTQIDAARIPFFYSEAKKHLVGFSYSMGLGVIGSFAIVLAIINRKNKFSLVLCLAVLCMLVFSYFNLLLNLFQYLHSKIFIYTIPILYLTIADNLKKENKKKVLIALGLSLVFTIYCIFFSDISHNSVMQEPNLLIIIGVQVILILVLNSKYHSNRIILLVVMALLCFKSVEHSIVTMDKELFEKRIVRNEHYKESFKDKRNIGFYRELSAANYVGAINEYSPTLYSSLVNPLYNDFFNNHLSLQRNVVSRYTKKDVMQNEVLLKFFGVKYQNDKLNKVKVKPFIFGVENKDIFNNKDFLKLNKTDRFLALNNKFFVDNEKKAFKYESPTIDMIEDSEKKFSSINKKEYKFKLKPEHHRSGIIIIETNVVSKKLYDEMISVKNHKTNVGPINFYNEPEKRNVAIQIDTKNLKDDLNIIFSGSKNVYDGLKIMYVSSEELNKNDYSVIEPLNQVVNYNKSFEFDIDMPSSGYLGTSIFYDNSFIIKIDGKKVNNERVNNSFLGAKIDKGKHKVEIGYKMRGFKEGAALTLVGLFILAFIMLEEVKMFNRSFFRFALVGVFNTINYFVMYQLLLLVLPYIVAHLIGFVYSALCSYFITTMYTFKTKPSWKTFVAFPMTYLPNLLMSTFGTMALVELKILDQSIASLVMMLMAIPITFLINRVIFVKKEK